MTPRRPGGSDPAGDLEPARHRQPTRGPEPAHGVEPDGRTDPAQAADDGSTTNPAGFCHGAGLIVVHGNAAFKRVFGAGCVGLPAREGMVGLSRDGFGVMDAVLARGRPAARWVRMQGSQWRLTVAPRIDPGTGEIYGVAFHLRRRDPTEAGKTPE
jgi:hypothetical protein